MNRYSMVIAAVLGGAGLACSSTNSDSNATDPEVAEVENYLAALGEEITEDVAADILADDDVAQAGTMADGAFDADAGVGVRAGRPRRGRDGARSRGRGGCVDLVVNFADPAEIQACRDIRDNCGAEEGVCRDEVRACLDELRASAFTAMCEDRLAECDAAADADERKCERIQAACEEGFSAMPGKARGHDHQVFDGRRMGDRTPFGDQDRDTDEGGDEDFDTDEGGDEDFDTDEGGDEDFDTDEAADDDVDTDEVADDDAASMEDA